MKYREEIRQAAQYILSFGPNPVPRLRLFRDILGIPGDDARLMETMQEVNVSRWVIELECEQWPDGSWGRLHSQDTHANQKILTTEMGVRRGLALGLTANHPILCRAVEHLHQVIECGHCPDPEEKNESWPLLVQSFAASSLALLQPDLPVLRPIYERWLEIARRTFVNGQYDPLNESDALLALTGVDAHNSHLRLNDVHTLELLSSQPNQLPLELGRWLLDWLWQLPEGIACKGVVLWPPPKPTRPGRFERWLDSLEVLSRFSGWQSVAQPAVQWLWSQRDLDGLWNFGKRDPASTWLPLSDNWRESKNRIIDWSVRILCILARQ
jgi:hypothetical protein